MKKLNVAIALIVAGTAQLSFAAPYSQVVAFGDSLTDTGQYPDTAGPSVFVASTMSNVNTQTRRVTNRVGPTYAAPEPYGKIAIQYVAEALTTQEINPSTPAVPGTITGAFAGTNYAISGNPTTGIRASIIEPAGSTLFNPADMSILNQRNGYLVDNPAADPNALYYINGGANDVLALAQTAPAPATVLSAANTSMGRITEGVNALHSAGANYIMVSNIPDIGATALGAASGPAAAAGFSGIVDAYNATFYQQLAASDANIIPFDLHGLLREVSTNPSRYGFATFMGSATSTCFEGGGSAPCLENPTYGLNGTSPDPSQLIFADGIHPTTGAQAAIADYQLSILGAPGEIALLPWMGLQAVESDVRRISNALNTNKQVDPLGDLQFNLSIDTGSTELTNELYNVHLEGDSLVLAVDAIKDLNEHWALGASVSVTQTEFENMQSASFFEQENIGVSLITAYHHGRYQADMVLNTTKLRYGTITRHTPVGGDTGRTEDGDTAGSSFSIFANAAYDLSFKEGNWQYGPQLSLGANNVTVDAFSEYSGSITAMNFMEQDVNSDFYQPSLFANYANDSKTFLFNAVVGLRTELKDKYDDLGASLQSANVSQFDFYLPSYDATDRDSVVTEFNFVYAPNTTSRLTLQYRGDTGHNGYDVLTLSGVYNF